MTTHAPPRPTESAVPATRSAPETAPLQVPAGDLIPDSLKLLDHRTRRRAVPASLARRGPHLVFEDRGRSFLVALEERITHIGRGIGSDIRIEDQRVSASHAIIVLYGRHARILDNRSSNGTFVGGRRIVAVNLRHGDELRVGPVMTRYVEIT